MEIFAAIAEMTGDSKPVQVGYTAPDGIHILLGKATELPDDNDNDLVMVIDDIAVLVRTQEETAWGEVVKRLAHGIRNPLTPIQLSVEKLTWRLHDKLDEQSVHILTRSTDTIIKQVVALKEMVETFHNYAWTPPSNLERHDSNCLIEEVLLLHEGGACTFTAKLSKIPLWIATDTTATRQVLHNTLKNTAGTAESGGQPPVTMATRQTEDGAEAVLVVCNSGRSFSKGMLHSVFEPYVTDKPTGIGLGLPVIRKIIEERGGRISLSNRPDDGAYIKTTLPRLVGTYTQQ